MFSLLFLLPDPDVWRSVFPNFLWLSENFLSYNERYMYSICCWWVSHTEHSQKVWVYSKWSCVGVGPGIGNTTHNLKRCWWWRWLTQSLQINSFSGVCLSANPSARLSDVCLTVCLPSEHFLCLRDKSSSGCGMIICKF